MKTKAVVIAVAKNKGAGKDEPHIEDQLSKALNEFLDENPNITIISHKQSIFIDARVDVMHAIVTIIYS